MHAKVLVVDGRRALVGAANLTHRALTANLEAGVLIEDAEVAADLETHVRGLMRAGTLVAEEEPRRSHRAPRCAPRLAPGR